MDQHRNLGKFRCIGREARKSKELEEPYPEAQRHVQPNKLPFLWVLNADARWSEEERNKGHITGVLLPVNQYSVRYSGYHFRFYLSLHKALIALTNAQERPPEDKYLESSQ